MLEKKRKKKLAVETGYVARSSFQIHTYTQFGHHFAEGVCLSGLEQRRQVVQDTHLLDVLPGTGVHEVRGGVVGGAMGGAREERNY